MADIIMNVVKNLRIKKEKEKVSSGSQLPPNEENDFKDERKTLSKLGIPYSPPLPQQIEP
jgi:hypothetical protein